MLELLAYLRANGFKTFIVSGGGIEFMRVWAERVYGVPPEQVVGQQHQDEIRNARRRTGAREDCSELNFMDDKAGKPIGINAAHRPPAHRAVRQHRRRPGDARNTPPSEPAPGLAMLVHHTDGDREYAYDAKPTSSGSSSQALTKQAAWLDVSSDMKDDWKRIFAFEQ